MKNVPEKFVKDCIALAHKRTSSGESLASVVSSLIYDVYAMGTTIGAAAERERILDMCKEGLWDGEGIKFHLEKREQK